MNNPRRGAATADAIDENFAIVRFLQTGNQSKRRRLAAARRPSSVKISPGSNREAYAVDGIDRAEALDDIAKLKNRRCHG